MNSAGTTLGPTLRTWRDRLSPTAVGLPPGRVRRAKGLRREELAELAGLSVDYVVRLEQGRATTPSAQVVAALARALQLDDPERDHLHRLAGLVPPPDIEVSESVPPGLRRMVDRLADTTAAAVFAADWQLIWWNRAWVALLGDPSAVPPRLRNFARDNFPADDTGPHLSHWPVTSLVQGSTQAAVVSDLRRATGRFPDSERLASLIHELSTTSEEFVELWASGTVSGHREDRKIVDHPRVGPITVDCDVLNGGDGDQKLVVLSAVADSEDETNLRLAIVSGHPPAEAGPSLTAGVASRLPLPVGRVRH